MTTALPFPTTRKTQIHFTVYARPEPQGSSRAFVVPGKGGAKPRAVVTSANPKMKPYRQELTNTVLVALAEAGVMRPFAEKHIPVSLVMDFYLARPSSIPKKRIEMVVKPDIDKLCRSTIDSLAGLIYQDDAQVVEVNARKHYGTPERVEISAQILERLGDF